MALTPSARAAAQVALDREAERLLKAGWTAGPSGCLQPPSDSPIPANVQ